MARDQAKEIFKDLDQVAAMLIQNEAWHARAANQCRNIGVRGWGKWHDKESLIHKLCLDKTSKLLQDKLNFTPEPNLKGLQEINQFTIRNLDDFIDHHFEWIGREEEFNEVLSYPLQKSKAINRELHERLEALEEEAQRQIALVKMVFKRIKFANFMTHDIAIVSRFIEDYFDYEYVLGCPIKFNIG